MNLDEIKAIPNVWTIMHPDNGGPLAVCAYDLYLEIKEDCESLRNHLLAQCKLSNEVMDEKEKLRAALELAIKQRDEWIESTTCNNCKDWIEKYNKKIEELLR